MEIHTEKILYPPMPIEVARRIVDGTDTAVDILAVKEFVTQAVAALDSEHEDAQKLFEQDKDLRIRETLDAFLDAFEERHPEARAVVSSMYPDSEGSAAGMATGAAVGYEGLGQETVVSDLLAHAIAQTMSMGNEEAAEHLKEAFTLLNSGGDGDE